MKCLSVSRNLTATVLVLLLAAASAPAALALPAGPAGEAAAGWDVQVVLSWVQEFFGGFLGGGPGEEEGSSQITDKARAEADVNGLDLNSTSTVETTQDAPSLQDGSLRR